MKTYYLAPVALLTATLILSGCATGSTEVNTEPSVQASTIDVLGGDPSTWSPEVIPEGKSDVSKGQFLVLGDLPETPEGKIMNVFTSDDNIVSLTQVGPDNYAVIEAQKEGEAVVRVYFYDEGDTPQGEADATYSLTVTLFNPENQSFEGKVFDDTPALGSDPESWTPVNIDPSDSTVNLVESQYAIIETSPFTTYDDSIEIVSSDPTVIGVVELMPDDFGLVLAGKAGTATLTVDDTDGAGVFMTVKVTVSAR